MHHVRLLYVCQNKYDRQTLSTIEVETLYTLRTAANNNRLLSTRLQFCHY